MTSGYAIHEGVLSRAEAGDLLAALSRADVPRTRAGARHVLALPAVREVARDPRLLAIAAQYLGPGAMPFHATLFDKSPAANWLVAWHQDTALPLRARIDDPAWGPWSTKAGVLYAHAPAWALEQVIALRISLDDSTLSNGPLRLLPDTHHEGVLSQLRIDELARVKAPVDCVASAGGVVVMRPLTVHASSKSTSDRPRRVLHIEYAGSADLGRGVPLVIE
jgi:ectoine hydroxylase-related dioxygenase (phytanoyl-CoA dioxygenase family)